MIWNDLYLHNVGEAFAAPDGSVTLQRVPESIRPALNANAQERVKSSAGMEIRFVQTTEEIPRVTVSAVDGHMAVTKFRGVFQHELPLVVGEKPTTITLAPLPEPFLPSLAGCTETFPFAPQVWRLMFSGGQLRIHGVEGGVRPPTRDEMPRLRYLAYGTSITHGARATRSHLTYVAQAAMRLGVDPLNQGLGGACQAEPELADWFASRDDWDIATLALSVNMIGANYDGPGFRERVSYMIDRVAASNPARPVACISIYPHHRDYWKQPDRWKATPNEFRTILEEVVAASPHANVHFIPGPEILPGLAGLTTDMIHPADDAMIMMGQRLAERLVPLIP